MTAGQTYPFVTDTIRDEVYERGQAIYGTLKPQLSPHNDGKYVVIHIESGDYEIAPVFTVANRAMWQRHGADGLFFGRVIGDGPDGDYLAQHLNASAQASSLK
jgi:hypothetical protein